MKHIKKSSSPPRLASLLLGAALLGLVSQSALAVGTAANTLISNTATLNYTVGATPVAINSVAAEFRVDNKVNLTVARVNAAATTVSPDPLATKQVTTTFTVANIGNAFQDIALLASDLASGTANPFGVAPPLTDSFNVAACTVTNIVIGAGTMGSYVLGVDQHINALSADGTATVTVSCTIPAAQADNTLAVISMKATAHADDTLATLGAALVEAANNVDPLVVDIVLADGQGVALDDALRDAAYTTRDAFWTQTAVLGITKSATLLCDPFNGELGGTGPKNIPGALVQYAITITNTGTAAATLSTVVDNLQVAAMTFDTTLTTGQGAAANCVAGAASQSSGLGFGAVEGLGATTYAAPGPLNLTQDVTAGASFASPTVTIDFPTLAGTQIGAAPNNTLPAGGFITIYFNAFVK